MTSRTFVLVALLPALPLAGTDLLPSLKDQPLVSYYASLELKSLHPSGIQGMDLTINPIRIAEIGIVLLPKTWNFNLGYSRDFSQKTPVGTSVITNDNEARFSNLSISVEPFKRFGSNARIQFTNEKYSATGQITGPVTVIGRGNETTAFTIGQKLAYPVEFQEINISFPILDKYYLGMFRNSLSHPISVNDIDPNSFTLPVQTRTNLIYQYHFVSYGLMAGMKPIQKGRVSLEDVNLNIGQSTEFSRNSTYLDYYFYNIPPDFKFDLTKEGYQIMQVSLAATPTYKLPLGSRISTKFAFPVAAYRYIFLDRGGVDKGLQTINDYRFSFKVVVNF